MEVTATTGIAESVQGLIGASSAPTVLLLAAAINVVVAVLRNIDKIPVLKLLGIQGLVGKLPPEYIPAVLAGLTTAASVLMALSRGTAILPAVIEGLLASTGAVGINEVLKPGKKQAGVR
jgi:hypothetical protein